MNGFWGVVVRGDIVEKTVGSRKVVLGGVGLVGGELADSGEEEQGPNYLLDPGLLRGRD